MDFRKLSIRHQSTWKIKLKNNCNYESKVFDRTSSIGTDRFL